MRTLFALSLVSLAGCANLTANFCDTFFRARNVCRDQEAQAVSSVPVAGVPVASQPVVVPGPAVAGPAIPGPVIAGPAVGCAIPPGCAAPVVFAGPQTTQVVASPIACDCAGTIVMSPGIEGESVIFTSNAMAVETVSEDDGHPMLRPFRRLFSRTPRDCR